MPRPRSVTPPDDDLLALIEEMSEQMVPTIRELAARLGAAHSTVGEHLSRLKAAGRLAAGPGHRSMRVVAPSRHASGGPSEGLSAEVSGV